MIIPGDTIFKFNIREPHRSRLLETPVKWGHGGLSEVTFYRTYSRRKSDGTQETWQDCCVRVVEGMFSVLRTHAAQNRIPWREERGQRLALEAAQRLIAFKWTPPGRGLWMMGTDYVWERGGAALNNCAFVSTQFFNEKDVEATLFPFRFLMDTAMLGIGPGFDVRGAKKIGVRGYDNPRTTRRIMKEPEAAELFRVPDTREGWVEAISLVIRNGIFGGLPVELDTQDVRPEGQLLKGFGGVASGPLPLIQGAKGIAAILEYRRGDVLHSVDITDIMNLIGKIVVAGNVRRTAEIGFAPIEDYEFRTMKNWDQFPQETGNAPPIELKMLSPVDYEEYLLHQYTPQDGVTQEIKHKYRDEPWAYKFGGWRWASNNSVFAKVGMDYEPFNDPIANSGEPGFFWQELARSHGRLRDLPTHADYRVMGANPCFTGDTLVWTANGHRRFDELAASGEDVQVLTRLSNGRLAYRTMHRPRLTEKRVQICEVTLESTNSDPSKREITRTRCTPQHVFYLRNGREIEAKDLTTGMSLDSAYRYRANHKGYMRINNMLEHHVPFDQTEGLGSKYHVHHKDKNKKNNSPDNLELMLQKEHDSMHMRGDNNPIRKYPECNAKARRDVTKKKLQELYDQGLCVSQIAVAVNCSRHTVSRRLGLYGHGRNHRVISVRMLDEYEDVYCGTVEETERFYIALGEHHGVLVHNCVEQSLEHAEMCNLVENYPSHAEAPLSREEYDTPQDWAAARYWDYQRSLKFSYLYAKTVTLIGTHIEESNEVMIRNRRIGCSMSGVADCIAQVGRQTFFTDWCERAYAYIGYLDKKYSDWLGVRQSIKRTSMKPSGTVGLVAGTFGPGAHFPKATGYRTMRIARGSPVVVALQSAGYRVEPAVTDPTGTVVAYFPWLVPEGVLTDDDSSIWEQMKMAADLQYWWADNQVSYTATFTKDEAARGEISRALAAFDGQLKGISFLEKTTGSYAQMPFTRAPRPEVEAYALSLRPLNLSDLSSTHEQEDKFCQSEACEITK